MLNPHNTGFVKPRSQRFQRELNFYIRHLRDREKEDRQLKNWENKRTLVLVPVGHLPREADIHVHLYPGLLAQTGELGLSLDKRLSFRTYNHFSLLSHSEAISGDDQLKFCFSNSVQMSELVRHMDIVPAVEIPEHYKKSGQAGTSLGLYLPFALNTDYTIQIDKRLKDIYGNRLDKDYEFTLHVGDYRPYARIPTGIHVVESNSDLRFPVVCRNVDSVYLEMGIVDVEEAIPFLNTRHLFSPRVKYIPSEPEFFAVSKYWHAHAYERFRNEKVRLPIELREVLGKKKSEFVFIQFSPGDHQKAFLEVGDLGVTWKYAPENNLVWVS